MKYMQLALRSVFLVVLAVFILKVSAFTSSKVISNVASRAARHIRHNNLSLNRFMGNSNTAMSALRDEINADISGNDVVIYSKTYCPYCTRAKAAVQAQGVNFKVIELDVSLVFVFIQHSMDLLFFNECGRMWPTVLISKLSFWL